MKTVFNIVLVLCAAALIYICYTSIMGPINFENAKKEREKAVIARLIDIRKAQQEYRSLHRGMSGRLSSVVSAPEGSISTMPLLSRFKSLCV